jgi:hypothetical protein
MLYFAKYTLHSGMLQFQLRSQTRFTVLTVIFGNELSQRTQLL